MARTDVFNPLKGAVPERADELSELLIGFSVWHSVETYSPAVTMPTAASNAFRPLAPTRLSSV